MYLEIILDFISGVYDSMRIDILYNMLLDSKIKKIILAICSVNFLMYFIPALLVSIVEYIFDMPLQLFLDIISYPIGVFSLFFHLFNYLTLINTIPCEPIDPNAKSTIIDSYSLAITMTVYNFVVYFTNYIVNYIFHYRMYVVAILINFSIITMYHSFYCFNNLWQRKRISEFHRIDMCEKLWPYYVGYGIVPSIIYMYTNYRYVLGLYNIYITLIICFPFYLKIKIPTKIPAYPNINLNIISYITKLFVTSIKKLV